MTVVRLLKARLKFINVSLPILITMLLRNEHEYHLEALVLAIYNENLKSGKSKQFPVNDQFYSIYDNQTPIKVKTTQSKSKNPLPIEKVNSEKDKKLILHHYNLYSHMLK